MEHSPLASHLVQQREEHVPDIRGVVIGGFFEKLPEALDDLIEDILPQSLICVLRVRILNVVQDHLLIESQ